MKKVNNSAKSLSMGKVVWKSLCLGLKVKTPVSLLISLIGIPIALLPLLLSEQLSKLTDLLFDLSVNGETKILTALIAMLVLGLLFLVNMFYNFLAEYYTIQDNYRTEFYMKQYVLQQVCHVHYSYIENRDDFLKKIEFADTYAVVRIAENIQMLFLIIQKVVTFLSVSIALWKVHPILVVIVLVTSIPAAVISYFQSDESFRKQTVWSEDGNMILHFYWLCAGTTCGIQDLRHYELYDYLKARWRAAADHLIEKKNKLTVKHLWTNMAADFLRSAVYLVILLITAKLIYENPLLGVGTFTLVYTLSSSLQSSTSEILTGVMRCTVGLEYLTELFLLENLEREEEPEQQSRVSTGADAEASGKGEIVFDKVSFTYPDAKEEVLHEISVSIRPGEKIAVVGDNGSGKSTFISLLTGMFRPNSGDICIDGKNLKEHKSELRKQISVIFQNFAHYEGTLRENITVSDQECNRTDEEIMGLAKSIHVEDVIEEQENGLDGLLGNLSQKGRDLSGGQWQKIALLRAVYRGKTSIMILDEPTAALDPLAEAELYRNFAQITGNRTTLLISHRLGITKLVDRILVFQDGRIIEDGNHQELMKKKGQYYAMYQAQASWYQNS